MSVAATFIDPATGRGGRARWWSATPSHDSRARLPRSPVSPPDQVAITWGLGTTVLDARSREVIKEIELPSNGGPAPRGAAARRPGVVRRVDSRTADPRDRRRDGHHARRVRGHGRIAPRVPRAGGHHGPGRWTSGTIPEAPPSPSTRAPTERPLAVASRGRRDRAARRGIARRTGTPGSAGPPMTPAANLAYSPDGGYSPRGATGRACVYDTATAEPGRGSRPPCTIVAAPGGVAGRRPDDRDLRADGTRDRSSTRARAGARAPAERVR